MIQVDSLHGYRQRGYDNARQVASLEQTRSELLADLRSIENSPAGSSGSLFSVMGDVLGLSPDSARHIAFTSLAIILDLCAVAALLTLASLRSSQPTKNTQAAGKTPAKPSAAKPPSGNTQRPAETLQPNEQQLAVRILAGEFGQPPSVRELVKVAKGGHATVKKIMEHLLQTNQVRREGKRYHLVQNVIA